MLASIDTAQLSCYLESAPWASLLHFCQKFMEPEAHLQTEADLGLHCHSRRGHLRAERFALAADKVPWQYLLQWTLPRDTGPLDPWLTLHWAGEVARQTHSVTFCDLPPDLVELPTYGYFQVRLQVCDGHLQTYLCRFRQPDEQHFIVEETLPLDLRGFPLFQTQLPLP